MSSGLAILPHSEIKGRLVQVYPDGQVFVRFCQDLRFGEIENLKIQGGLPMLAEELIVKIRFVEDEALEAPPPSSKESNHERREHGGRT